MNINNFPTELLLKIIAYLPMRDQVRLRRVSNRFNDISIAAVADAKRMNVADQQFRGAPIDVMEKMMRGKKIERISAVPIDDDDVLPFERLQRFVRIEYAWLVEVNVAHLTVDVPTPFFGHVLSNCPNLKRMRWTTEPTLSERSIEMVANCENLESVEIGECTGGFVHGLAARARKLTHLTAGWISQLYDWEEMFSALANFERLEFKLWLASVVSIESFWRMESIRSLSIENNQWVDDVFLKKVSEAFVHLEELEIRESRVTSQGVQRLASLNHLRVVDIGRDEFADEFDDREGPIAALTKCRHLREITCSNNGFYMPPELLIHLVRDCDQLQSIRFFDLDDIDTIEEAMDVLASVNKARRGPLYVEMRSGDGCIWDRLEILHYLSGLKEEGWWFVVIRAANSEDDFGDYDSSYYIDSSFCVDIDISSYFVDEQSSTVLYPNEVSDVDPEEEM